MIIGLTGKKQAGKNTVAKALAAHSPLPVVEVSFAAKLKESAAATLGVTVDVLERWKNDPHAIVALGLEVELGGFIGAKTQTVREFLQRYGTEGHRDVFGEDFWIDAALPLQRVHHFTPMGAAEPTHTLTEPSYTDALYVVTDVRFSNEAQRVRDLGGTVVRVIGPKEIELAHDDHASEEQLDEDGVDFFIDNSRRDDSFASLDYGARKLLKRLGVEHDLALPR